MLRNADVREICAKSGIRLWEVAAALTPPLNDGNFSRKLRSELSAEEKLAILKVIEKLRSERGEGHG